MSHATPHYLPTASGLRIALSDLYPDATYGAVPVVDQFQAPGSFDDRGLAEVPQALAAYVGHQQHASF